MSRAAPDSWFSFSLAFAHDGPDLDTVQAVLGLRDGWVVHIAPADEAPAVVVVVFAGLEQGDERDGWAVYVLGHRYDASLADEREGERVRIPLAGARLTVY